MNSRLKLCSSRCHGWRRNIILLTMGPMRRTSRSLLAGVLCVGCGVQHPAHFADDGEASGLDPGDEEDGTGCRDTDEVSDADNVEHPRSTASRALWIFLSRIASISSDTPRRTISVGVHRVDDAVGVE